MGDGGYQVVRMLIISARHFRATRAARRSGNQYKDTSENSDALGLGIKLQARAVPFLLVVEIFSRAQCDRVPYHTGMYTSVCVEFYSLSPHDVSMR